VKREGQGGGKAVAYININHIVRKCCKKVFNDSGMAAEQFLLDLSEIWDTFRHSVSLLAFNEVCEINLIVVHAHLCYAVGLTIVYFLIV